MRNMRGKIIGSIVAAVLGALGLLVGNLTGEPGEDVLKEACEDLQQGG